MRKKISFLLLSAIFSATASFAATELYNVSYDPTREYYKEIDANFAKYYKAKTGQDVTIKTTHGGSGKQARSVIDGSEADVVTLALAYDIDAIANAKLLPADWQKQFPNNSSPYTSTIVFLVKKGNPKGIKDWDDLAKAGVSVITPNPKTSGGARWNFLAAYGYGLKKYGSDAKAQEFIGNVYKNVAVLDSGARGATLTFTERGIGDVLIAWEDEADLITNKVAPGKFEVVNPSVSIVAEAPVAVVEKNTQKHGTTGLAKEYLSYLYSKEGQEIALKNFYRPTTKEFEAKVKAKFPAIKMVTINDFGGWQKAQATFFADGGVFDKIYAPKR